MSLSNYSFWYLTLLSLTIIFVARCFKRSFLKFAYDSAVLSALKLLKTPVLSSFADLYYLKVEAAPSMPSEISATWEFKACTYSLWPSPAYWWVVDNFSWLLETWSLNYKRASFDSEVPGFVILLSMFSFQCYWSATNYSAAAISTLILPHCSESDASSSSASASAYSFWQA